MAEAKNKRILYRDFHQARANDRRKALLGSLDAPHIDSGYSPLECNISLGLPFKPMAVTDGWQDWPALPDLFPTSFPGVQTGRDKFLIDTVLDALKQRIADYFDPAVPHEHLARRYPRVMTDTARFDARSVRDTLRSRGGPNMGGFVRYAYRPFDNRWLYWESETKLLREKSPHYPPHVFEGNLWLSAVPRLRRDSAEAQSVLTTHLASLHLNEWGVSMFPAWLRDDGLAIDGTGSQRRPNLSLSAQHYLDSMGAGVEDLFHHVIATLHDPGYRTANAGALHMEWPRIPLPGWPDGITAGPADALAASAARGRQLAALLDSDTPVAGVTIGLLPPELAAIAVPMTTNGGNMAGDDFAVSAGWGHFGTGEAVMPGQGRIVERDYTDDERNALGDAIPMLGDTTFDVYLNEQAYWRNVPAAVWDYQLGGYQVLKKWLSYRESKILDRPLLPEEVQHFTDTARRIAAIIQSVNTASGSPTAGRTL